MLIRSEILFFILIIVSQQGNPTVGKRLFIGNISWTTTNESLKAHFEQIGEVEEANIVMDNIRNRSKGFGFVTMASEELAQKAVEELNGKELDGRELRVDIANPPKPRSERSSYGDDRRSYDRAA